MSVRLKKNLGAIGIGPVITLVGGVAVAVFTAVTYVQTYVAQNIQPVQAQVDTLQNNSTLLQKQTAVIGANLLLLCQSNQETKDKCAKLPTQ